MNESIESAFFGAGCFWGVEKAFRKVKGVIDVTVGYAGGNVEDPSYKDVCMGTTGHAEVIKVVFDSTQVSYSELLKVFWSIHNPTTPNRQGPDIGSQYRSIILYTTSEQQAEAEQSKQEHSAMFDDPIVTEVVSASPFYRAEEYHQCYLEKKGRS